LGCTVLGCTVLDCAVLDCAVLDCAVLDCAVLDWAVLDCAVLDWEETEVDRRAEELATRSPLGAERAPRSDTDVSARPGRASFGPDAGPTLISPAHQDAKLEDFEGLPGGRLGTARQFRPYL